MEMSERGLAVFCREIIQLADDDGYHHDDEQEDIHILLEGNGRPLLK